MTVRCPSCNTLAYRNGHTKAGSQRWKCSRCDMGFTVVHNSAVSTLKRYLEWLFGSIHMLDMPGGGRTFRRKIEGIWKLWPAPYVTGVYYPVVEVDGIHLSRNVVLLIAASLDGVVISWYVARSENSRAWTQLLSYFPPPEVIIADGGAGLARALRDIGTPVHLQRCLVHVQRDILRLTTRKPRTKSSSRSLSPSNQTASYTQPQTGKQVD